MTREVDRDHFIENVQKEEGNLKVKKNRKGCLDEEEKMGELVVKEKIYLSFWNYRQIW